MVATCTGDAYCRSCGFHSDVRAKPCQADGTWFDFPEMSKQRLCTFIDADDPMGVFNSTLSKLSIAPGSVNYAMRQLDEVRKFIAARPARMLDRQRHRLANHKRGEARKRARLRRRADAPALAVASPPVPAALPASVAGAESGQRDWIAALRSPYEPPV